MAEVPVQPQPTPQGINWKTILIGAVIGGLVIVVGALGFYLYQGQSEETTSTQVTTPKTSTDSAKQATPSAKKDGAANWKVVTSNLVKVKFKVPPEWEVKETEGIDSNGEKINIIVTAEDLDAKRAIFTVNRNPVGGLSLDKTRDEQVTIDGFVATKVYFQDRPDFPGAIKGEYTWVIWPPLEIKGIKYDINALWSVGDKDSLEALNKILDTLEFL